MTDFIAMIYEWFGYHSNLGTHLKGWDELCTGFIGTDLYLQVFLIMVFVNLGLFILMYLIIDKFTSKFSSKASWWMTAAIAAALNFGIAYTIPGTVPACEDLHFGAGDLMLFGIANACWSLVVFALLTSFPFPRNFSTNARLTTFWKP
ncbi:hypothetical protein [Pedobacter gandavensis]|uniref:hypothetical protein n=1 Tax=Pedobacter gandavensis TaxID=2679963 RepID=UPI00292D0311|nr:hypothetical protein [Pedobacter gandavensis]